MGSNASGKTTQSKLLHSVLSDSGKELISESLSDDLNVKATIFSNSAHVGHLKDNQCTGTDTINSKNNVDASFCHILCNYDVNYIIVDGILCTATWLDIFKQFPEQIDILVVLLQFPTLEQNLRRVVERRVYKKIDQGGNDQGDIEMFEHFVEFGIENLEPKTLKNVSSKFKGFKSMFEKVKSNCQYSLEINASLSEEEINIEILHRLSSIIN